MEEEINKHQWKVSVTIPKGVDDGTRIRLAGNGEAGTERWLKWRFIIYKC